MTNEWTLLLIEEKVPMQDTQVQRGVVVRELSSWTAFCEDIEQRHSDCPALIYRGQAHAEWKVESTLDRYERRFPLTRNRQGHAPPTFDVPPVSRETHLAAFRQAARGKLREDFLGASDEEWWALAQHHGLATPMLDWTLSPYIALFFAFEEEWALHNEQWTKPTKRAVFAVSSSCVAEEDEPNKPAPRPFAPRNLASYRLMNQAGLFLLMPRGTDLESYVKNAFAGELNGMAAQPRIILEKFTMPSDGREACLKSLNKMNINRMSLFPDLDGAARYINALWEIDFDTSLGHIRGDLPPLAVTS